MRVVSGATGEGRGRQGCEWGEGGEWASGREEGEAR